MSSYSGKAKRDNRVMLSGVIISVTSSGDIVTGGSMTLARSVVEAAGWGRSKNMSNMHVGRRFCLLSCLLLFLEGGGSWGL